MKKEEMKQLVLKQLEKSPDFSDYKTKYPDYKFYGVYTISTNLIEHSKFDVFVPKALIDREDVYTSIFINDEILGTPRWFYVYLIPGS